MRKLGFTFAFAFGALCAGAAGLDYYVEYVEANGNQWVDTAVRAADAVAATVEVSVSYYETYYRLTLLGGNGKTAKTYFSPIGYNGNCWQFWYGEKREGPAAQYGVRTVIDSELRAGYQKITVDGASYQKAYTYDCNCPSNMTLFALNNEGSISEKMACKLYGCKIYSIDETDETFPRTLVRDFRPCVDTDGVICLYDTVSAKCFYSSGTAAFPSVGPRYNETTGKFDLGAVTVKQASNGTIALSASDAGVAGRYRIGESVTLTATPKAGYALAGWTGLPVSQRSRFLETNFTFTVEGPMTISATFAKDRFGRDRTAPLRLYCAPVKAGTGDGSDWENAQTDVAEACRSVGLNPAGGEVWIKTGAYYIGREALVLYPNVKILGGFAGTETAADEANPAAHPTVLHGDSKFGTAAAAVWRYRATIEDSQHATDVPVMDGLDLNEPPAADHPPACSWQASQGDGSAFSRVDGCATNTLVAGIRFATLGSSHSVTLKNAVVDGLVISNCAFWASNRGANSAIYAEYCPLAVCDTEFVGCCCAVHLYSPATRVTADLRRCSFRHNDSWQRSNVYAAGCFIGYGNVHPTFTDCVFDHNVCNASYYGEASAVQTMSAWTDVVTGRFERCLFTRNAITNKAGSATVFFNSKDASRYDFVDSQFVANTNYLGCGDSTAGVGSGVSTHVIFRNCYLAQNCIWCPTVAAQRSSVFYVGSGWGNVIGFINSTVESNRVEVAAGAKVATILNYRAGHYLLLNSVFRDNDAFSGTTRGYDLWRGDGWTGNGRVVVFNSIMTHTAADYIPLGYKTTQLLCSDWCYGYSYIKNLGTPPNPSSWCFTYGLLTEEPTLDPGYVTNGRGVPGLRIAANDASRRKAVNTWTGNDGFPYFWDEKLGKWHSLRGYVPVTRNATPPITDAEAATLGLSRKNVADPDFRGVHRPRRASPGPVDFGGGAAIRLQ